MKRIVLIVGCLCLIFIPAWGQAKLDLKGYKHLQTVQELSDTNQVLVVVSVQGPEAKFLQVRGGPQALSFVKVQPVIGARFAPDRGKRPLNEQDSMLFFFDQVKIGETYKLFDFAWEEGSKLLGYSTFYWGMPGIMGSELTIEITKPGVIYMGAFMVNDGLKPDLSVDELTVLQALSENLKRTPGWKNLVDERIKELTK